MSRLIAQKNKKTELKVKNTLENNRLVIQRRLKKSEEMTAAEALMLGQRLLSQRDSRGALEIANQLLTLYPNIVDVPLLRLRALLALEHLFEAGQLVDDLLERAPRNLGVIVNSAKYNMILGESEKAIKLLSRARKQQPQNVDLLLELGQCYNQSGQKRKSIKAYELAEDASEGLKENKSVKKVQALIGKGVFLPWSDSSVVFANQLLLDETVGVSLKPSLAFALANHSQRKKDQESEVRYITIANELAIEEMKSNGKVWNNEEHDRKVDLNLKLFDGKNDAVEVNKSHQTVTPIFILAMPRSGTTLQEQMLGSHSLVGQTGESRALTIAIDRAYQAESSFYDISLYPEYVDKLSESSLNKVEQYYYEHQRLFTKENYIVDKDLSSYRYAGLAAKVFPKAKFIHMNRAPMDMFLSCYRGNIPGVPSTFSLVDMVQHYIGMKRLVGHWKRIMPDRVHIVNYADLVNDPEGIMRETLRFLNLDWEPDILEFHKRKNVVRTLSVNQVRQGIYKTSVKKWLPYRAMLQPAIDALEDNGIDIDGVAYL